MATPGQPPNDAPQLIVQSISADERIALLEDYLREKEIWENDVLAEIKIEPQTAQYETYKGPRGDEVKKAAERIRRDILTEKEEGGAEAKKKGDDAFRAGKFEDAVGHYRQAIVYAHPHNAVCWSNMAAALLKIQRWTEAEQAAQMALREHSSVHGWHTGMFHIKVYHRLGLANREMGRWEVAAQCKSYFFKAIQINPNNSAAKEDGQKAIALVHSGGCAERPADYEAFQALAKKRWEEARAMEGSWAESISEEGLEVLLGTGCQPWAEDIQDSISVSKGILEMELPLSEVSDFAGVLEDAQEPGENARSVERDCHKCHRMPGVAPHMFCPACYAMAYCSNVCAVLDWKTHKTYCHDNRIVQQVLPKGQAADANMFKKIRKFDETRKQILGQACFVALGLLSGAPETRYDFRTHAGVIFVKYDPDPKTPVKVLEIKKMGIPELEAKYPASFSPGGGQSSLSEKRAQMEVEARKDGALGTAVCITIVVDGEWHSAMCAFFPVTMGFLDSVPKSGPGLGEDWEQYYIDVLNNT